MAESTNKVYISFENVLNKKYGDPIVIDEQHNYQSEAYNIFMRSSVVTFINDKKIDIVKKLNFEYPSEDPNRPITFYIENATPLTHTSVKPSLDVCKFTTSNTTHYLSKNKENLSKYIEELNTYVGGKTANKKTRLNKRTTRKKTNKK